MGAVTGLGRGGSKASLGQEQASILHMFRSPLDLGLCTAGTVSAARSQLPRRSEVGTG